MLPDSGYVQEEDIKYVNKIHKRKGLLSRKPLYTRKEAEESLKYFRALDYHKPFALSKNMTLTFYEAGHILGSAVSVLDIKNSEKNIRLAYAVDLGRVCMPLLRDPEIPQDIDYLIIEGTYGGRKHEGIKDAEVKLAEAINRTVARGGKIIIPSFALERTQLIVFFIAELIKRKMIKEIPIYVDGPLAVNLTRVFRENAKYFDDITYQAFLKQDDPLGYDYITYVRHVQQSKKLNDIDHPVIIISASGMCEHGRILHHLKNNIENPKNTVVVIGYMAANTLGRNIVERKEIVRIFGRPHDLRAEVVVLNSFSSHADKNALAEYVKGCGKTLKKVFLVHGESSQLEEFGINLKDLNLRSHIPSKDEVVKLEA